MSWLCCGYIRKCPWLNYIKAFGGGRASCQQIINISGGKILCLYLLLFCKSDIVLKYNKYLIYYIYKLKTLATYILSIIIVVLSIDLMKF